MDLFYVAMGSQYLKCFLNTSSLAVQLFQTPCQTVNFFEKSIVFRGLFVGCMLFLLIYVYCKYL